MGGPLSVTTADIHINRYTQHVRYIKEYVFVVRNISGKPKEMLR